MLHSTCEYEENTLAIRHFWFYKLIHTPPPSPSCSNKTVIKVCNCGNDLI